MQSQSPSCNKAFTLIELLIVVAIIAILAAIAAPNFAEAQVRAKVSRSKNDLRTMATAMEAYFVDHNSYTRDSDSSLDKIDVGDAAFDPGDPQFGFCANGALTLTTPVAYISSLLKDPFVKTVVIEGAGANGYRIGSGTWSYSSGYPAGKYGPGGSGPINNDDHQKSHEVFGRMGSRPCYVIIGVGPDAVRARMGYKNFPYHSDYEKSSGAIGDNPSSKASHKGQPMCYVDYDATNGTASLGDVYRFGGADRTGRYMLNGQVIGDSNSPGAPVW